MCGRSGQPRAGTPAARLAVLLLPGLAAPALAHSVSVSRGTLWIEPDRLRVELLIPADDLLHTFRPAPDAHDRLRAAEVDDLVQRYADLVQEQFILRDADGQRLTGRLRAASHDLTDADAHDYAAVRRARVTCVLEYVISAPPQFLTLQQTFFSGAISHAAQLALEVRLAPDGPAQTVVLTNRGNAETIEVECAEGQAPRVSLPERLRGVRARVTVSTAGVDVAIDVPLGLAETWRNVRRAEPDFLTPQEQADVLREVESLLRGACAVEMDSRPTPGEMVALGMLGPGQLSIEPGKADTRLSAWSARLTAHVNFPAGGIPQQVDLTWALFNNAVLEAHVTVTQGNSTTEHILTPYAPKLSLPIAPARP